MRIPTTYLLPIALTLLFLIACLALWRTIPGEETINPPPAASVQATAPPRIEPLPQTKFAEVASEPSPEVPDSAAPVAATGHDSLQQDRPRTRCENVTAEIRDAVTRYDKAGLQMIGNHLWDNDPKVRAAARQGLMQLGDTDAIPLLEKAASLADDAAEAEESRYIIRFLRLPPVDSEALHKLLPRETP